MIAEAARRLSEAEAKKLHGRRALGPRRELAGSAGNADVAAHVNIEGLVGGYTGPGGKTILPGKARRQDSTCAWCPT